MLAVIIVIFAHMYTVQFSVIFVWLLYFCFRQHAKSLLKGL